MLITYGGFSLNDPFNGVYIDYPEDMGTPPIRGDNVVVPFRHGSIATPKFYAERTITLQGYVWGSNRAETWQRIDRVKQAFAVIKGPQRLEIYWPDGTKRYLIAEVRNTMGFQGTHRTFTPFSVELTCSDPFWRDDAAAQETPFLLDVEPIRYVDAANFVIADYDSTYDTVLLAASTTFDINNPGIIPLEDSRISITTSHALTALTVKNLHSGTEYVITYPMPANSVITVDCTLYQATLETGTSFLDITNVMRTPPGQRAPYIIPVGVSTMQILLTGSNYLASVALYYAAAYL